MFVVEVGSVLTTIAADVQSRRQHAATLGFELQITLWLWFTVLFANFAEAMAEGRGKAQADTLRKAKAETTARPLRCRRHASEIVASSQLRTGDIVLVAAGEFIPGDGEVIEGVASVDESAITGESAPVIREAGGDRSAVTGGTRVLSDWIKVRITSNPGETFLDRMIALVEGAERQKTPNEIALNILLAGLTIIFLLAVVDAAALCDLFRRAADRSSCSISLLVCLIPTTIGGLLSAIGIAGMDRLIQHNVLAMSGRAVEAAGDVNTLLLDKTGTITLGNRQASRVHPARRRVAEYASPTPRNSLRSPTKHPKAAPSSCSQRRSTACAAANSAELQRRVHSLLRADAHVAASISTAAESAKALPTRSRKYVAEHGSTIARRSCAKPSRRSPTAAARRWSSPKIARRSA